MKAKRRIGTALALALGATPATAEQWQPLDFGPPNLATALEAGSVVERGGVRAAWFAISRADLHGTPRLIRKERYEFHCADGESRLSAWGDFYPDGRLAAAGLAPATAEFKPVALGGTTGHAVALWRAACGRA
ncbi:MAG TPA: hypothetical protein VM055_02750 [Novosphingobium sp.]|nr:hypothetical protein [Novosphingobium sp.]